jgi:CheY-like chemotaxis protein
MQEKAPTAPPASPAPRKAAFNKDAVYSVTKKGKAELGAAGTVLSAAEVKLLVLIDGQTTVAQLLKQAAPNLAPAKTIETLDKLDRDGLVTQKAENEGIEATGFFTRPVMPLPASATAGAAAQADFTLELLRRQGYVSRIVQRAAEARQVVAGQKLTLLVIEDDAQLVKLLRMFLQMEGYELRIAGNREEITAALRLGKPDVVLLDVTLPDADGFDVLIRMRQHPVLKEIPVIMMTAKASREAVLKGLAAGATGYITKPFDVDVIVQALKSVLGLAA